MNFEIPEKEKIQRKNVLEFYGAIYNVAKLCGLDTPHIYNKHKIIWQHGWKPDYFNVNSKMVIAYNDFDPGHMHLVARKDQEIFLKNNGYKNVEAIGLPICYLPDNKFKRRPNSLLVVPVHSLDYTQHAHWNFENYANTIHDLAEHFDEIVACVHPSCFKKGYWVKDFEKLGIKCIEGADSFDKNALLRLQYLFSSFEFVTTNGFGSHVPYAALFGAKVSIFGEYCDLKAEDFKETPFYNDNRDILEPVIKLSSIKVTMEKFPELFTHPTEAREMIAWAKREVGWDNRRSINELKEIFHWNRIDILKNKIVIFSEMIRRLLVKTWNKFAKYGSKVKRKNVNHA